MGKRTARNLPAELLDALERGASPLAEICRGVIRLARAASQPELQKQLLSLASDIDRQERALQAAREALKNLAPPEFSVLPVFTRLLSPYYQRKDEVASLEAYISDKREYLYGLILDLAKPSKGRATRPKAANTQDLTERQKKVLLALLRDNVIGVDGLKHMPLDGGLTGARIAEEEFGSSESGYVRQVLAQLVRMKLIDNGKRHKLHGYGYFLTREGASVGRKVKARADKVAKPSSK